MKYKKALVTGGAGFIGSHIVDRLLGLGIETTVYDNLSVGKRKNVQTKAKLVVGDILDCKTLEKSMQNVDVVFHNAARVSIRGSFENFHEDVNTNLIGTVNVLRAAIKNRVKKIIFASSMAVYPDNPLKTPMKEDGRLEPSSPYGTSKMAGERLCLGLAKHYGFSAVCLRYFNTYGPRQTLTPYVGVITIFINRLLEGVPPVIFGDGKQMRDFIYVGDVAEANILAMEKDVSGEIFNIGTGVGTSVNEVAKLLIEKINPKMRPTYGEAKCDEHKFSVADVSKAGNLLGFKAKYKLKDKMGEVIDFIKTRKQ